MTGKIIPFPDPRYFSGVDGIVYVGGSLNTQTLAQAYSLGIFPWPVEGYPLLWHCPEERGILDFSKLHIPKSLQRFQRKSNYTFSFNRAFPEVIKNCAKKKRLKQDGTWITPEIISAYIDFHKAGYAHSVECWDGNKLIAGLYGVYVDGLFSGESMFAHVSNASKLCLLKLIEQLDSWHHQWMDIQMLTPITEALGGEYISRLDFLNRKDRLLGKKSSLQF